MESRLRPDSGLPKQKTSFSLADKRSSRRAKTRSTRCNNGVVIKVVTNAIMTRITKIEGGSTPISYPIFSATSSISPRVFISVPIVKLSFQDSPTKRAATAHPPSFPATATVISSRQTPQSAGLLINPISVRNPVKAKKRGRKKTRAISSTFSIITLRNPMLGGITTPAMKAPNRA